MKGDDKDHTMMHYQNIFKASIWVLLIAIFVMMVWLVQQSKYQSVQLAQIVVQERQWRKKVETKKVKQVENNQQLATQNPSSVQTIVQPVVNLPKDAQALLEKSLVEARQLRKLAKSGQYKQADALIKGLKDKIWQASDMLPKVKKESLRKLMGILDYTSAQLKLGKTGDTKIPLHTIKNILDGKDG